MFRKKEPIDRRRKRVLGLAKNEDCGMMTPPMDAQVAMQELCRYLLGEDWYFVGPGNVEQGNTEIVFAIESRYKEYKYKQY